MLHKDNPICIECEHCVRNNISDRYECQCDDTMEQDIVTGEKIVQLCYTTRHGKTAHSCQITGRYFKQK
jgi:hypothetical protein